MSNADLMRRIEEDLPPSEPPMRVDQGKGSDARPNSGLEGRLEPLAAPSNPPPERREMGDVRQEQEAPHPPRTERRTRTEPQVSRESSIAESRRWLLEAKISAWQKEADTLEASVMKVHAQPSVEGVKLLRGRKEDLEKKSLEAHNLYKDVLSSSLEEAEAGTLA